MYPTPAPPTITGPNEACNSATLVAVPGDNGNGIQWDDNSTAPVRTLTATTTCAAISTSPYGCTSATATFACTVSTPAAAGSAPDPLCCCQCGLALINDNCAAPAQGLTFRPYVTSSSAVGGWNAWTFSTLQVICPWTADCQSVCGLVAADDPGHQYSREDNFYYMCCSNPACTSASLWTGSYPTKRPLRFWTAD